MVTKAARRATLTAKLADGTARLCKRCKKGRRVAWDGREETCRECDGTGYFTALDEAAIRLSLKSHKGAVRSTPPFGSQMGDNHKRRCYYVWRMARFNGGVDMTMPVVAMMWGGDDAYKAELDTLADTLAQEAFGTDMAGTTRWGRALGLVG